MAKTLISIRLDNDLLDWLKAFAPDGYQKKISEILNEYKSKQERNLQRIIGRSQQIFDQYYARCFWHMRKDLEITAELIPMIQNGLRKYGGREGMRLADEIDLSNH